MRFLNRRDLLPSPPRATIDRVPKEWMSSFSFVLASSFPLSDEVRRNAGEEVKGRKMASFKNIVPVLKVADLQRSLDFYTGVLDFSVAWRADNDGGGENAMLHAGATNLLLSTGSHLGDTPQFTGTLYFSTTGVQKLFEAIKEKAEIVWPLETMDYGQREFGIRDPDGYTLAFAESAEFR